MDFKQLEMLALETSVLATVFGFGLKATSEDLLYVVRRPGLLTRSLFAMFVIMPVVAVTLDKTFHFTRMVEIVLVALAISPIPPLLPQREAKAGGKVSFGLGLMAILAAVSVVTVPASVVILEWYLGRRLAAPSAAAGLVFKSVLVPLAAGMIVRAVFPAFAMRYEKVIGRMAFALLSLAAVVLLAATMTSIYEILTPSTVVAFTMFIVIGLAVGHVLGGPNHDNAVVLALSTACRHPAIALTIATANAPDLRFGPTILLYLLLNVIVGVVYVALLERRSARMVHAG